MLGLFSFFSFFLLLGAAGVVFSRHTVHAVLSLIFAFFNAAALLIMIGAEFVGFMLIVVYVGAVAVLFLFVVMMLDVDRDALRSALAPHKKGVIFFAAVFVIEILALVAYHPPQLGAGAMGALVPAQGDNVRALGLVLYTQYAPLFYAAGMILLLAMIGAIVLTLRQRSGVRRQNIAQQNARRPEDTVTLAKPPTGEGVL
ncbi:MAG: NADH-quinone oxidoreductase subunit J [Alphaproteobacteria bacterium]